MNILNTEVSHQGVIVFTNNRMKAKSIIDYYIKNYEYVRAIIGENDMKVDLADGRRVKWVKPSDNARGHRCSEVYIDKDIDDDILNTVIKPICIHCTPETMRII